MYFKYFSGKTRFFLSKCSLIPSTNADFSHGMISTLHTRKPGTRVPKFSKKSYFCKTLIWFHNHINTYHLVSIYKWFKQCPGLKPELEFSEIKFFCNLFFKIQTSTLINLSIDTKWYFLCFKILFLRKLVYGFIKITLYLKFLKINNITNYNMFCKTMKSVV